VVEGEGAGVQATLAATGEGCAADEDLLLQHSLVEMGGYGTTSSC